MTGLKGKALVSLATLGILGGASLGAVGVSADTYTTNADTDVAVGFSDNGILDPITGPLSLVNYPAAADFGTGVHANTVVPGQFSKTHTYSDAMLSLWDAREAEESTSWTLTGSASDLTSGSDTVGNGAITFNHAAGVKDWIGDDHENKYWGCGNYGWFN